MVERNAANESLMKWLLAEIEARKVESEGIKRRIRTMSGMHPETLDRMSLVAIRGIYLDFLREKKRDAKQAKKRLKIVLDSLHPPTVTPSNRE